MAVYTQVTPEQAAGFVAGYDLGAYRSHEGIAQGVSNSNFHLFTETGRYILTLFEKRRVDYGDLPFFFAFSEHLAGKGILCPRALPDRGGEVVGTLAGHAAAVLEHLDGKDVPKGDLTPAHCAQAGDWLARMHLAAADFAPERANSMGIGRWPALVDKAKGYDDRFMPGLYDYLRAEMDFLAAHWPQDLPRGAVHADFFPDNVFFRDGEICAVIDFYFACTDFYAFDLAVSLNAWCFEGEKVFSPSRFAAMMDAYRDARSLSETEAQALPVLCRGAAFRTLISRLEEFYEHDEGTLMQPHDPAEYLSRLRFWQGDGDAAFCLAGEEAAQ